MRTWNPNSHKIKLGNSAWRLPSLLALSLFSSALFIPASAEAGAACHCRNSVGERVQVGNYSCIKTNEGLKEARCEYVLNNTAWKFTGNLCPFTHYQPRKETQPFNTAVIDLSKYIKSTRIIQE